MRKKSHIALAKYLVRESGSRQLLAHKYAFYLGSILPDIKPSFLYRRHEITATFPAVQEKIRLLASGELTSGRQNARYYRQLGEVAHYIADYFTFPHNHEFSGGFRAHCSYEEDLKKKLHEYITSGKAASQKKKQLAFAAPEALFSYLETMHEQYLLEEHSAEEDMLVIVPVCFQVLKSIIQFLQYQEENALRIQPARA